MALPKYARPISASRPKGIPSSRFTRPVPLPPVAKQKRAMPRIKPLKSSSKPSAVSSVALPKFGGGSRTRSAMRFKPGKTMF